MHIGAELERKYPYKIFDQNIDKQAIKTIKRLAATGELKYLGMTVMPGPQLFQAIPISKRMKERFPNVKIIWGGYFATLHASTVLDSGYVDFVIRGPGEKAFIELIEILEGNSSMNYEDVRSLSFRRDGQVVHNEQREPTDPNLWPPLPFHKIHPERYLNKTYLGSKTAAYYSSAGCPFLCGFCAIASIYRARWLPRSPDLIVSDLLQLKSRYDVDAVEFFDENFFTSEKRTSEFASKMIGMGISWWGEGRPDTVLAYSDETLRLMKQAGCKMIFFGAESSSLETLKKMHKGGTQTPDTVLELAARLKHVGIVPEFSFVLGSPSDDIDADIDRDITFIRKVKETNPSSEIILYMYAPVVFEDSELSRLAGQYGFEFPHTLEDWMKPEWQKFDLRKTPVIPWLKPHHYEKIRSFERVLNGYYPTVTDVKLTKFRQTVLRGVSGWRYRSSTYTFPLEIRALLRLFRYRQPELEGF
jgi:radical SAM superfamily enzyme YgiQ (UPF0313 family)